MTNEPLRLSKQINLRLINRPTKINFVVPVVTLNNVDDILELHSVRLSLYIFTKTVLTSGCFLLKVLIYDVSEDQPIQIFVSSQLPQPKDIPVCWKTQ